MKTIYKPIKFPKDGGKHNHMIEWWYFNGHLKDKKGNIYSFMNCLFKVDVKKIGIPFANEVPFKNFYFAHSIVSDIKKKKTDWDIKKAVLISKDSFKRPLLFVNYTDPVPVHGYENSVMEETTLFNFRIKNNNLDLNLKSNKKPLFESGNGFPSLCGNKTFYYSLTNMEASGIIVMNGKEIEVSGKAWMDHQWTNSPGFSQDKWNWFSIQLDNNTEIVCAEYISGDKRDYWVDIVYPNGKQEHLKNFNLKPSKVWQSKKTKEKYPLQWEIEIPATNKRKKINLSVSALIKDQEIYAGGLVKYWEGPTEISGIFDGKKVKGKGFMEIVGHISSYGVYSFDELKKAVVAFF